MKSLPFPEAREYVHKLKLKSSRDWIEYCKTGKKPRGIPYSPDRVYRNYWKVWSDLGSRDIRDVIKISRLAKNEEEISEIIRIIKRPRI